MNVLAISSWPGTAEVSLHERTDKELVGLTRKGDTEAYSELVRRHQQVVYNLSYRYMRNSALADDMAQEAFLKGFRLLKGFRGDCSFSTWMYRVTGSVCLTEIARRKRRNETEMLPHHEGTYQPLDAQKNDMAEAVRRCVTRLPEKYAKIVTLYYLKEMRYDEIAEIMDVPLGTLKTWMHRARKELRGIVEDELGGFNEAG